MRKAIQEKVRENVQVFKPKQKCRCYINAKFYARQASKGGNMKGYIPCPIHEKGGD